MTIEQIIKLSDIGFTAEEIKQLSNGGIEPAADTKPAEPAGDPKPADPAGDPKPAEPAGDPKPAEPAAETAAFSEAVNALMKEISGLKKTIQATNILNSTAGQEKPESVDTILKSFMKGTDK